MVIRHNAVMAKIPLAICATLGVLAISGQAQAKTARPAATAPAAQPAPTAPAPGAPMTRADVIARLRAEFAVFDTNKDGYVSQQELAAGLAADQARAVAEMRRRRAAAFDAMDTNHDGQLSRDEFLAAGPQPGPVPDGSAILAKLDTNHDGSLSFDEFAARALAAFDQRQASQAQANQPQAQPNQNGR